jgi:hypothetical protein
VLPLLSSPSGQPPYSGCRQPATYRNGWQAWLPLRCTCRAIRDMVDTLGALPFCFLAQFDSFLETHLPPLPPFVRASAANYGELVNRFNWPVSAMLGAVGALRQQLTYGRLLLWSTNDVSVVTCVASKVAGGAAAGVDGMGLRAGQVGSTAEETTVAGQEVRHAALACAPLQQEGAQRRPLATHPGPDFVPVPSHGRG